MCQEKQINSVESFIQATRDDYKKWGIEFPWFRGEPTCDTPLTPKLYRKEYQGDYYENRLLQYFRTQAPAVSYTKTPDRQDTDLWLFLAQHVGLPTRLLDWTEGSLIALYFALQEKIPIVWMLNPFELNSLSAPSTKGSFNIYGPTWTHDPSNIITKNIHAAWQNDEGGLDLPVAIHPTNIHPRMAAQRSRFTVHGKRKESLCVLLSDKDILKKYVIDDTNSKAMLDELRILGVSRVTLFPEIDVLAQDLTRLFRPDLVMVKDIENLQ